MNGETVDRLMRLGCLEDEANAIRGELHASVIELAEDWCDVFDRGVWLSKGKSRLTFEWRVEGEMLVIDVVEPHDQFAVEDTVKLPTWLLASERAERKKQLELIAQHKLQELEARARSEEADRLVRFERFDAEQKERLAAKLRILRGRVVAVNWSEMSERTYLEEAERVAWFADFASDRPDSHYHAEAEAALAEAVRRGQPELFWRAAREALYAG